MPDVTLNQENVEGTLLHTLVSGDEVIGYVAVDSTINGRSCGGLRMLPDVGAAEVVGLARAMTLKYGFLGLPQGGAKGGVRGDPEAPVDGRRSTLARFANGVAPLLRDGTYAPHPDMGTCAADVAAMLQSIGLRPGRRAVQDHDSGYYTAVSVAAAALAALRRLGLPPVNCRAAIEGFGKVGRPLARLLQKAGLKVVAVSTRLGAVYDPHGLDVSRLLDLSAKLGSAFLDGYPDAQRISTAELLELPVELLSPCARHHSLHGGNAPRLLCRLISAGANNPATPEAERILAARGVLCLPDFVSNCGGVLGGTMEFAGIPHGKITELINLGTEHSLANLLELAENRGVAPRVVAEELARERFEIVKQAAENPNAAARLLRAGLTMHRHGLIPARLVGLLAPAYFRKLPFFTPGGSTEPRA
jgi:glutamate dehydrogenase (NAD(P)+)